MSQPSEGGTLGSSQGVVHIVLAEDNPGDVFLMREALRHHAIRHDLHVIEDGQAMVEYIRKIGTQHAPIPDLVLLDLNLPRASGHEILEALRAAPGCGRLPVIVVTSSDAPTDRSRAAKYQINHYFRKPADLDQYMKLGAVVKMVLES